MSNIRATFSINAAGTVWGAIDGDISNQTDLQDALNLKADKSELETDIEEVNTAISNLSDTVLDNYNTLDDKIDTEISNRVTADEDLQDNIDTLGETVAGNYNTLNEKIDELSDTVTDNYTELNNKILDNTADITTNTSSITNINGKIPEQASAVNQLADKNFVNSSIATNTANFIGTFNSIEELEAYSGTLTNNDYAFVATTDSVGNTLYDRYKWNGSEWLFEYELNNSSFTANQWASINSGITDTLTAQITTNQNSITNIQNNYVPKTRTINGKALNTNITLNASDVNALANTTTINDLTTTAQQNALNSGATSAKINQIATNTGNITTNANAISTINGKIPTDASSSNKLVTASALSNAVVNLANQDLNNLTETGNNRLHALKSYSDNGELLTDAEGLADVIKYAHSTFDLSKFTVTGNPTITDDGILTYANSSNAQGLIIPTNLIGKKPFVLKFRATRGTFTNGNWFLGNSNANSIFTGWAHTSSIIKDLVVRVYNDNTSTGSILSFGIVTITEGKTFDTILSWDGSAYTLKMIDANDRTVYKDTTVESSLPINTNIQRLVELNSFNVGITYDLKQFSITVDGVEVFSGNKTGIDTIKPDDYTVVGTPTISDDGVASGFSGSNYLTVTKSLSGNIVEVNVPFKLNSFGRNNDETIISMRNSSDAVGGLSILLLSNGRGFTLWGVVPAEQRTQTYNFSLNTDYLFKCTLDYTLNKLTITLYENGVQVKTTNITLTEISNDIGFIKLGRGSANINSQCLDGSIDLNAFKIYVDGNLVYQPCLKIPYTQGKTGSKIVNAVYRDRVNDMAEQFGYANYYTLDEDNGNFTLPQGELFGLIGDKTLRDSYYNGATYWELFSNRRLEQGGSCESGVEYTFPKPFADTNYILTIPYSSKTATSFIPSATGDFIAKGTGLL